MDHQRFTHSHTDDSAFPFSSALNPNEPRVSAITISTSQEDPSTIVELKKTTRFRLIGKKKVILTVTPYYSGGPGSWSGVLGLDCHLWKQESRHTNITCRTYFYEIHVIYLLPNSRHNVRTTSGIHVLAWQPGTYLGHGLPGVAFGQGDPAAKLCRVPRFSFPTSSIGMQQPCWMVQRSMSPKWTR